MRSPPTSIETSSGRRARFRYHAGCVAAPAAEATMSQALRLASSSGNHPSVVCLRRPVRAPIVSRSRSGRPCTFIRPPASRNSATLTNLNAASAHGAIFGNPVPRDPGGVSRTLTVLGGLDRPDAQGDALAAAYEGQQRVAVDALGTERPLQVGQ